MSHPGASIGSLCARILEGEAPGERDLEALLRAGDEAPLVFAAARGSSAGGTSARPSFSTASSTSRPTAATVHLLLLPRRQHREPSLSQVARRGGRHLPRAGGFGRNLLDLTMGEDPLIHDVPDFAASVGLVAAVREGTACRSWSRRGCVPDDVLAELAAAGADWYACYQETHTASSSPGCGCARTTRSAPPRAARRRAPGCWSRTACSLGVGETVADRASSVLAMRDGRSRRCVS